MMNPGVGLSLQGRKFGDPVWTSLHFGIESCGAQFGGQSDGKYEGKNLTDAGLAEIWSGKCKSESEMSSFTDGLRINVW